MKTKANKSVLAFGAVIIFCLIIILFSPSIYGGHKRYEVKPQIYLPEYATDTPHIIYVYENMIDRLLGQTENNLNNINTEIKVIAEKLDSIETNITELSTRIERVETALGIEQPKKTAAPPKK